MSALELLPEALEAGIAPLSPKTLAGAFNPLAEALLVAHRHGIDLAEMLGERRYGCLPKARAELYVVLLARDWSYPQIAKFVGDRDHTSVISAVRKELGLPAVGRLDRIARERAKARMEGRTA